MLSMCVVTVFWSCVEFVPLKLLPPINIVLPGATVGWKIKSCAIWVSMKRDFGGGSNSVCLTCIYSYLNITQLKNPVCMNIISVFIRDILRSVAVDVRCYGVLELRRVCTTKAVFSY